MDLYDIMCERELPYLREREDYKNIAVLVKVVVLVQIIGQLITLFSIHRLRRAVLPMWSSRNPAETRGCQDFLLF
jgi:hypothetical protein